MLKQILKNEIRAIIGHEPSDAEYLSATQYVMGCLDEKDTIANISLLLHDWCHDEMLECEECGEFFLADTMKKREISGDTIRVCSDKCFNEYRRWEKPEISQHI